MIAFHRTPDAAPASTRLVRSASGVVLVALLLTLLAACGGGGGDAPSATASAGAAPGGGSASAKSEVPAAALASVDGLLGWMRSWVGSGDDGAQPLAVGAVQLPVDDRSTPAAIR
ncbi:MAG: hypothetical protein AB7P21_25715 [Lautropia sp.]